MGIKYKNWIVRSKEHPDNYNSLSAILYKNRDFVEVEKLDYGDYGLEKAINIIVEGIRSNKRIALYADYDVDGTMSCVSWIWFLESIGYKNFTHYIPDRFKEGYGVNLKAVQHLVEKEHAQIIITMDTGITANEEAKWCKQHGAEFICTDHHKVQADNMPDCTILNPKLHPDPMYQELCGCGITFVLLRKLAPYFNPPQEVWVDILALTGMATICDMVPLNGVNHKLAQVGVQSLWKSQRPILKRLLRAAAVNQQAFDERDVGFRLGPRINAVGRLDHADKVIEAFIGENIEPLISYMNSCNEKRKNLQAQIVEQALEMAEQYKDDPILFLGGPWHQGVVGIAASKLSDTFWKPVWLFNRGEQTCKGSARSIPGFDVTEAMFANKALFNKCGGHKAAGGYSFDLKQEEHIRKALNQYAQKIYEQDPKLWESRIFYDCKLKEELTSLNVLSVLNPLRPFGLEFEEPIFEIEAAIEEVKYYKDKNTGLEKHTAVFINLNNQKEKVMFFNEVHKQLETCAKASFLVTVSQQFWQGKRQLSLMGCDYNINSTHS